MTVKTKTVIKGEIAASSCNKLFGGTILTDIVDSYQDLHTTNAIYAQDYGVKADNSTDDSAAWAAAIAAANALGNCTIIAPQGVSLAPTLAATISGINIWIVAAGGPGTSLIKGGVNNLLTWTGYAGGAINMAFDNTGAPTNITIDQKNANLALINTTLGSGIGTFVNADVGAAGFTVQNLWNFNGGVGNANVPLFVLNNGNGYEISGAILYTGAAAGSAAANRGLVSITGGSLDTLRMHDNFIQEFAYAVNATAVNGQTPSNFFFHDNVWDGMNAGYVFTANVGGTWLRIDIQDKWISATNTAGISFVGAGTFDNINISTKIVGAGTSGIISTASGTFKNVKIMDCVLTGINSTAAAGTADGINLAGGAGYSNISIIGNSVGAVSQGGTQPKTGCSLGAVIDHLIFVGNDCQGTVANYQGMQVGTTTRFAHTNCIQQANVGLANNPATFSGDVNNVITITNAAGTGDVLKISGNNAVDNTVPSIRTDGVNLVLNGNNGGGATLYLNADNAANLNINAAGGTAQLGSGCFTANGAVATALTSVGPAGSHTTVQEWLTIKDAGGTVRYIPCF